MYITNPEVIPEEKIYWCCGIIGEYLIFNKNLPLLCKKGRQFGFMRTSILEKAISEMPFWLKLSKIF